ncbi:hypothetical protein CfE428DRAFT_5309 [Chthoniobacter flavus Ellin428]|uniref:Right handed beta helix domain-containing protein n=1 Tax=Chthoniobacter flavus Ellin428 TaxID=497964 RepID=B4D8R9_9BACT|nr:right-handed parallel beta-helix repeat-containing protein [Chthoniobacter flavus]EDY17127.1 hypothetical protein CfE428DRAFT_5309 [Chthoniobacter flavus Ellin428]TCO90213.1 parallel beta helix pectate lyase-like protein [Chthoniobacter flavus]
MNLSSISVGVRVFLGAIFLLAGHGRAASLPFITTFANDTVGGLPAGWSGALTANPAVTTAQAAPADAKSVVFTAVNQGMQTNVGSNAALQWDFWIQPTGTGRSLTIGTFDSGNRYGIWLTFGNTSGQVSYYANNTWNTIPGATFVANQWYRVRLVGRLDPAKTFDFYLSAAGGGALPDLPQGRNLPVRDAATVDFTTVHAGTYGFSNAAYFDDSAVQLPVTDGFDSDAPGFATPAGWTNTGTTVPQILASGADGTVCSVSLYQTTNRIEHPFPLADEVTIDAKVYPTSVGRTATLTIFDETHRWGPYLSFGVSSGKVSYFTGTAWMDVPNFTFTANAWYRVRLVARSLPAPSFDIYLSAANSDTLPATPQGVGLPLRDPLAVDFATFGVDGFGETAPWQLDSVEITQGLEPATLAALTPANNTTAYIPTPSFTWTSSPTAESYDTQIATDAAFTNVIYTDNVPMNRYVANQPLPGGDVYWRVRGHDSSGLVGTYSPAFKFTIAAPTHTYNLAATATVSDIQTTIANAVTPAVVNFAASASYTLAPTTVLFTATNKSDLIINGNGANITFTNPMCGLAQINNCQRVLIRDLTVDYNPVPFSVGTIVSTTAGGSFTMTLDSGMPPFNAPHMLANWTWGVLLDPTNPGKIQAGTPIVISTVSQSVVQNGNQYTLQLGDPSVISCFIPGRKYIQFARNNGGTTFVTANGGADVTCYNLVNYAISGAHYMCLDGSDFKVLHCHSLIKSGRWFGGNADGVHARFNTIGPWVEQSEFNGIGDDSVALYSKGVFIQQKLSNTSIRLDTDFFNFSVGDTFTIFNPRDGVPVAENLTVTSKTAVGSPTTAYDIGFTPAVTGAIQTSDPNPVNNDQVFTRTKLAQGFMLRGNTFHNIRRYGSIIRASSGVVENNHYDGISDVPIIFRNEPDLWRNGLQSTDIIVSGNTITNSGFSTGAVSMGQIQMSIYKLGSLYGAWRGHQRITISDNVVSNWQEYGISVLNGAEISLLNNEITADPGATFNNSRPHYGIYMDNSQDSEILNNSFTDPRTLTLDVFVTTNTSNITVQP